MNGAHQAAVFLFLFFPVVLFSSCASYRDPGTDLTREYTISDAQVTLAWDYVPSEEIGFEIERRTEPEGSFSVIATVDGRTMTYTDNGLERGKSYRYRVKTCSDAGKSPASNEIRVTVRE